jgi:hypothetical protein
VEETTAYMASSNANGKPALPKRSGPKGLLPSTWLQREIRVAYMDACGSGVETSGTLLDFYPFGVIVNIRGAKTALSWEAVRVVELVDD